MAVRAIPHPAAFTNCLREYFMFQPLSQGNPGQKVNFKANWVILESNAASILPNWALVGTR